MPHSNGFATSGYRVIRSRDIAMGTTGRARSPRIVGRSRLAGPRVRGVNFRSEALPKHRRRLQSVDQSVTELWLDGLATRDFEGTLRAFLGAEAPLSAATITRTNRRLLADFTTWNQRRLDDLDLVFTWADGVYLGAGPNDERRVFLVVLGADRLGRKHLVALRESISESEAGWCDLFADLAQRGLRAPHLLVADGAAGLWAAAEKAWPRVAQQRCWLHKMRNVEEKLPDKQRSSAHAAMAEIMHAELEQEARRKLETLAKSYERKYPKAAACLRDDRDRLFAYYRFPHETWTKPNKLRRSIFRPTAYGGDENRFLSRSHREHHIRYAPSTTPNVGAFWLMNLPPSTLRIPNDDCARLPIDA